MFEPRLTQRLSTFIAALACLIFAFGVRDTPERPLRTSIPTERPIESVHKSELTVEVHAVDASPPTSLPLGAALVRVFWNDQGQFRLVGSARSNEQGRARIKSLPRGVLWILAEGEGRARSSTQLVMDEDERVATLSLPKAERLELTVLDEQGKPIENATLLVTANDPLPHGALTERNGQATLSRLGPAPYRVKASARGYESVQVNQVKERTVLRLRRLGALLVKVEDERGQPVAGASVTLAGTTLWPARKVATNAQGLANVRGLLAGSFDLRARKERSVSPTELGIVLGRGEEREVTLRLAPGRFVTVWVTDGEGEPVVPVANADVVVAESGLSAFPERARTEASGKVTLGPFEPGTLSASAAARDFVGTSVVVVPETDSGPLRIALRRGGTVTGRVVDLYDHPIDGASLEMVGTDFSGLPIAETPRMRDIQAAGFSRALGGPQALLPMGELGVTQGPVPSIPGANSASGDYLLAADELRARFEPMKASADTENWVTRYDGSFSAHPVTPGRLRALARHPAYVEGQSELVTLQAGGTVEVKVVLRAGGGLEGVVVDRYGRPLGGARVELSANTGSRAMTTYTADDGAFAFAALPSEVTVSVSRPENPEQVVVRERVTVREGKRETLRVIMPEAREAVECTVIDERGDPIEGAEVRFSSLDVTAPLRQTRFTAADGRVTFADARDLDVSVSVESPGYAPTEARFSKIQERVRIALKRGTLITGRITQTRGRFPVAQARVTVVSLGRRRVTSSNAEGVWQMADVPDGTVHLIVEGPNLPRLELDRKVERQSREDRAFDLGEFDLPDAGGVAGTVVNAKGEPVVGARVSVEPVAALLPVTVASTGTTVSDAEGRYRLWPVAIGKVTLFATAPGVGKGQSEVIEILRDRDRDGVRIRLNEALDDEEVLPAGSTVAITLTEAAGAFVVSQIGHGSEAERAGLIVGDHLLSIDGVKPATIADARIRLAGPENMDLLLEIERRGARLRLRTVREQVRR